MTKIKWPIKRARVWMHRRTGDLILYHPEWRIERDGISVAGKFMICEIEDYYEDLGPL